MVATPSTRVIPERSASNLPLSLAWTNRFAILPASELQPKQEIFFVEVS